jgi:hemerythrin superfamily protein
MPIGTDLIRADHERVDELFAAFVETRDTGLVGQILDALTAHDQAESAALYPLALAVLGDVDQLASYELAHMLVKRQMDLLRSLEGPPLHDGVLELQRLVAVHVEEEERDLLPALEAAATPGQLQGLAARIEQNKQRVG